MKFSNLMRWFVVLLSIAFTSALLAAGGINTKPSAGAAIHGYDPVAYFVEGEAKPGDKAISYQHQGIIWKFSTEKNKQSFIESPEAYIPQYGGHCAYAASKSYIADADPEAWTIHQGKLYLNYNKSVRSTWQSNRDPNINKADKNWPELLKKVK